MTMRSNIDTLYRKYKDENDEKEKECAYQKLKDEMCKMAYYFAFRHPYIGEQEASKFLISVMEGQKSIIENYNRDADFIIFYKRVLELYAKNYIKRAKSKRLYNATIMRLQSFEAKNGESNIDLLRDDNIKPNPKLKKLLVTKAVKMYLLRNSVVLNDNMLRKIAIVLGADGCDLINKIMEFRKEYSENECVEKNRALTSSYFLKKIVGELDEKSKIKEWNQLSQFIISHTHSRVMAQKVSHKDVSKVFDIKTTGISRAIITGKQKFKEYSMNQTGGR